MAASSPLTLPALELSMNPRIQTTHSYFDKVVLGDVEQLSRFWHDNIVFEAVFSFTGGSSRTEGKAAVFERLSHSYGLVSMAFHITSIHETTDPEDFFVEYFSEGQMVATGDRYSNQYITQISFTDGLISLFREFYDPQKTAVAFSGLI